MFHQYLFNIFNTRVVCGDKRQNPLVTFFFCVSADCLEAKLTSDKDLDII